MAKGTDTPRSEKVNVPISPAERRELEEMAARNRWSLAEAARYLMDEGRARIKEGATV